jgi:hypothetical protein
MLREFAKKLKKNYGWSEADVIIAKSSENETIWKPGPSPSKSVESAQTSANPWFSKLTKKAATSMHQLLRISEDETMASMKWETFLKVALRTCCD